MTVQFSGSARRRCIASAPVAALAVAAVAFPLSLSAQHRDRDGGQQFYPGNLVVSRSVYDNRASNVTVGQALPPNCPSASGGCVTAVNNGTYPYVFNNDMVDGSFGITSRIYLDQITPFGWTVNSLEVPNSLERLSGRRDQLVTSFSSKSELALNLSTDHRYLTFMGYVAPVNALDVSNSNTPGAPDPTNPAGESFYRAVARLDQHGHLTFTETNAYSGNNGRAAILNDSGRGDLYYAAGNAGNGSNPQPLNVDLGAGAQLIYPSDEPESEQQPPVPPTPLASFSITQLPGITKADKIGKDDNFRGMTVFNNVVYYTKGSGGNGVNTVYFVDTTGTACPHGTGVPVPGAALPNQPLPYDPSTVTTDGLPSNMCILSGFPTTSNKAVNPVNFPFGLWFADANTLYVADEGDGYTGGTDLYTHAAGQTLAGLEKWVYNSSTKSWSLAYTLTNGLKLGVPYTIPGYPTGNNPATASKTVPNGLPWSPATDGLRNITGTVNRDGTATIWAITSTVSGSGDQGADPNRLVAITDKLSNTTAAGAPNEGFRTVRSAGYAEVLRGVSFTPGTGVADDDHGGGDHR